MTNELAAVAYHEAGHAVAVIAAFRAAVSAGLIADVVRPAVLVRKVEIAQDGTGHCVAMDIYSAGHVRRKPLMRSQIAIHLAGGIAEAASAAKLAPAADAVDLMRARVVIDDLNSISCHQYDEHYFAAQTLALLEAHWPAVMALAQALLAEGCIEGERVEEIVAAAMSLDTSPVAESSPARLPVHEYAAASECPSDEHSPSAYVIPSNL